MTDQEKIAKLEDKLKLYEQNGTAKLYYALNRKAWEMADVMNGINLKTIALDDPKDKTFDRLKVIWQDAASIAQAVDSLGKIAKVTGNEKEDIEGMPFIETVATKRDL